MPEPTQIRITSEQVRIAKTGVWILKAEDRKPADPNAQIQELFGALTADLSVWRDLAKYKPDLFVGLFMKERNESIKIGAGTLELLASRGVELSVDIYDPRTRRVTRFAACSELIQLRG